MIKLKIGGVPEHFNLPWQLYAAAGQGARIGVEIDWRDYAGGSGAIAKALADDDLDVGLMLTEGAVAAVAQGARIRLVGVYTESPLIWGIHVPAASNLQDEAAVQGARYAISRFGSGSHLMSFAHARAKGWPVESIQFVEVGSLRGAIDAFATGRADVFFWEKFMTKPLVDAGTFRRVGEFAAPWPAFVSAASEKSLQQHGPIIRDLLEGICVAASRFKSRPDAAELIVSRFGLDIADARQWLSLTDWASHLHLSQATVDAVADVLIDVGVIAARPPLHSLGL